MRYILKHVFWLAMFIAMTTGISSAAIYQKVPGSNVFLVVPNGFELTTEFSGFVDHKNDGSILIVKLPPAGETMRNAYNDKDKFSAEIAKQNFIINNQWSERTQDGILIKIYSGQQTSNNVKYNKWTTMAFLPDATYVISVQWLATAKLTNDQALDVFKSLKVTDGNTSNEQLDVLPFTFTAVQPFQPIGTAMNSSVMLGLAQYNNKSEQPIIIISKGYENVTNLSPDIILKLYILSLKGTVDQIRDEKTKNVSFIGQDAICLTATAMMNHRAVGLMIYAAAAKDGKPVYLHAYAPKGELVNYEASIAKIAASVALRAKQSAN